MGPQLTQEEGGNFETLKKNTKKPLTLQTHLLQKRRESPPPRSLFPHTTSPGSPLPTNKKRPPFSLLKNKAATPISSLHTTSRPATSPQPKNQDQPLTSFSSPWSRLRRRPALIFLPSRTARSSTHNPHFQLFFPNHSNHICTPPSPHHPPSLGCLSLLSASQPPKPESFSPSPDLEHPAKSKEKACLLFDRTESPHLSQPPRASPCSAQPTYLPSSTSDRPTVSLFSRRRHFSLSPRSESHTHLHRGFSGHGRQPSDLAPEEERKHK